MKYVSKKHYKQEDITEMIASATLFDGVMAVGQWHDRIKIEFLGNLEIAKKISLVERGFMSPEGKFWSDMPNRKELYKSETFGVYPDLNEETRFFSAKMFDEHPNWLNLELAQKFADKYNDQREQELLAQNRIDEYEKMREIRKQYSAQYSERKAEYAEKMNNPKHSAAVDKFYEMESKARRDCKPSLRVEQKE